jgi:excinuclease UvrABC ATPase subunit
LLDRGYQVLGPAWRNELSRFRRSRPCPFCHGARLKFEALAVKVGDLNILEYFSLSGALYNLDVPNQGLHMHETGKLIQVLQKLVDKGASVVVLEHNLDVI